MEATEAGRGTIDAARKRAAVDLVARYEPALRRTARRYSLNAEDAEDAFQRAMEILITKAPTTDLGELIRWTQTVTKHEALAVRRSREQTAGRLARSSREQDDAVDWVALVPAEGDGPDAQVEQREAVARTREALQALKPAERRALSLLASGYSYAEIGQITGFSASKVNRCLAEGRERLRGLLARSEDGTRCEELRPLLSAFCDGQASGEETAALREHLRACGSCRATLRAYRAAPGAVAALTPAPLGLAALVERGREMVAEIQTRLPGGGGDVAAAQTAVAGAAKSGGFSALAKTAIVCAAAAGGVGVGAATGVLPEPFKGSPAGDRSAVSEGRSGDALNREAGGRGAKPRARLAKAESRSAKPESREHIPSHDATETTAVTAPVEPAPAPEAPAPAPEPAPAPTPTASPPPAPSGDSAAGEFGP